MKNARITPSAVIAVIALVLACAGSAVAGSKITGKKIKDETITAKDVKDGSLTAAELSGDFTGPQGPAGTNGTNGTDGTDGTDGVANLQRVEAQQSIPASAGTSLDAVCPAGKSPIAGGYEVVGSPMQIKGSFPTNSAGSSSAPLNAWTVAVFNNNGSAQTLVTYAVCATVEGGFPNPG